MWMCLVFAIPAIGFTGVMTLHSWGWIDGHGVTAVSTKTSLGMMPFLV